MINLFTLRIGDIVEYAGRPCQIIRVSDCAAVVAVVQKPRTIIPRFGKPVTRISSWILSRRQVISAQQSQANSAHAVAGVEPAAICFAQSPVRSRRSSR